MKLKFGCILLGLAATAFAGSINIVQNGDFETGAALKWCPGGAATQTWVKTSLTT